MKKLHKKILCTLLSVSMLAVLTACGGKDDTAKTTDTSASVSKDGSVAVFYYTYGDTYISSVRAALDSALDGAGIKYQDYDSNAVGAGDDSAHTGRDRTCCQSGRHRL